MSSLIILHHILRQLNLEFISSSRFIVRVRRGSSQLCLLHPSRRGVYLTKHLYELSSGYLIKDPSLPGLQLSLLRTLRSRYVGERPFLFERFSCAMQPIEAESTPALRFPHMNYAVPGPSSCSSPALNVGFLLDTMHRDSKVLEHEKHVFGEVAQPQRASL